MGQYVNIFWLVVKNFSHHQAKTVHHWLHRKKHPSEALSWLHLHQARPQQANHRVVMETCKVCHHHHHHPHHYPQGQLMSILQHMHMYHQPHIILYQYERIQDQAHLLQVASLSLWRWRNQLKVHQAAGKAQIVDVSLLCTVRKCFVWPMKSCMYSVPDKRCICGQWSDKDDFLTWQMKYKTTLDKYNEYI